MIGMSLIWFTCYNESNRGHRKAPFCILRMEVSKNERKYLPKEFETFKVFDPGLLARNEGRVEVPDHKFTGYAPSVDFIRGAFPFLLDLH